MHVFFRIILIIIVLAFALSYTNKNLMPYLDVVTKGKAVSMVTAVVNETVNSIISENANFKNLVHVSRDEEGSINSIETDTAMLNNFSAEVSKTIDKKLSMMGSEKITVPFGSLFGNSIFSGSGPDLYIKVRPQGNVITSFESQFLDAGINQTRHAIFLNVKVHVSIVAPLLSTKTEISVIIPVAETVIVGSIPGVYIYRQ